MTRANPWKFFVCRWNCTIVPLGAGIKHKASSRPNFQVWLVGCLAKSKGACIICHAKRNCVRHPFRGKSPSKSGSSNIGNNTLPCSHCSQQPPPIISRTHGLLIRTFNKSSTRPIFVHRTFSHGVLKGLIEWHRYRKGSRPMIVNNLLFTLRDLWFNNWMHPYCWFNYENVGTERWMTRSPPLSGRRI